jgi:hypothetical protein
MNAPLVLALLPCMLLAGCSTSNLRRDLDVSGSLPRAIGLGAFTPSCIFLCFPSTTITQGDTLREVDGENVFTVHGTTTQTKRKGGHVKRPPPAAPAAPAAP